jgi:hypothetical protein
MPQTQPEGTQTTSAVVDIEVIVTLHRKLDGMDHNQFLLVMKCPRDCNEGSFLVSVFNNLSNDEAKALKCLSCCQLGGLPVLPFLAESKGKY